MSDARDNGGEPHRHTCPECAAPHTLDGTPSCSCNRRASEALRDARTAEAAAAEDFDPLRIRPFVELSGEPEGSPDGAPPSPRRQPDDIPTLAMPMAFTPTGPDSADLQLFENETPKPAGSERAEPTPAATPGRAPRRTRRLTLVAAAAAATIVAAAGFFSGLFSYDTPTRDEALPDGLRASVPDTSPDDGLSPTESSGAVESAPSAASRTPTPSRPSPSESPSDARGPERPSPAPPGSASSPGATPSEGEDQQRHPRTLRLGDSGPDVTELQLRLRQVLLYLGETDEDFDEQVEAAVRQYQFTRAIDDDPSGVYGTPTRERLESETDEPQRNSSDSSLAPLATGQALATAGDHTAFQERRELRDQPQPTRTRPNNRPTPAPQLNSTHPTRTRIPHPSTTSTATPVRSRTHASGR